MCLHSAGSPTEPYIRTERHAGNPRCWPQKHLSHRGLSRISAAHAPVLSWPLRGVLVTTVEHRNRKYGWNSIKEWDIQGVGEQFGFAPSRRRNKTKYSLRRWKWRPLKTERRGEEKRNSQQNNIYFWILFNAKKKRRRRRICWLLFHLPVI